MLAVIDAPPVNPLDLAVAALRARLGWQKAADAVTEARGAPISRRQLRRELRAAGRLEKFPPGHAGKGRPRKPALTEAECKLARDLRAGGMPWEDVVDQVNAGRALEARISDRTLRDQLKETAP